MLVRDGLGRDAREQGRGIVLLELLHLQSV
jgi:hypothetical protein